MVVISYDIVTVVDVLTYDYYANAGYPPGQYHTPYLPTVSAARQQERGVYMSGTAVSRLRYSRE
jgi:hypothetical protein